MKKLGCLIISLSFLVCGAGAAFGEDEIDFEITADFFSKYILRGQNLDDDPVFQSSISATYGDLTAVVWSNLELTNINGNSGDFTELDYSLDYSASFSELDGMDEAEGSYVLFALAHSIERIPELSPDLQVGMDIGASLGWGSSSYNKYYWGTDQSKLNDLALSASFPLFEIAGWTIGPSLNYVTLVSDDIRATGAYGTDSDFFFVGFSLSTSF